MDPHFDHDVELLATRDEIEGWLAMLLTPRSGRSAIGAEPALHLNRPRAERLRLIEMVLDGNPMLRSAAQRLSFVDLVAINLAIPRPRHHLRQNTT